MLLDVTAEDVASGKLVQPGWYAVEVTRVEDKPSKNDPNKTVAHVRFKIIEKGEFENVPLMAYFSEPWAIVGFANALGANIGKEGKKGIEISERTLKGKKLRAQVIRGEYQGRPTNNIQDYMPLTT